MKAYEKNKISAARVYFPHGWVPQINIGPSLERAEWHDMTMHPNMLPFNTPEAAIAWALDDIGMSQPCIAASENKA